MKIQNLGIEEALERLANAHTDEPVEVTVKLRDGKMSFVADVGELPYTADVPERSYGFGGDASSAVDECLKSAVNRKTPEQRRLNRIAHHRAELAKLEGEMK